MGIHDGHREKMRRRFLETGHPRDLTLFFGAGHGNRNGTGGDHYGHAGMVRRVVCGPWDLSLIHI